ncbi:MAG: hypothetical protein GX631_05750 [Dehalococcoidales bacterium]|nr:hypothetical protein [Dehalococcoidales bacterium]
MDIANIVNCGFGWILVILAVVGYYLTYKKMGEKWAFWHVLAAGWAFFALSHTLLLAGAQAGAVYIIGIWLCSYILVITAMVLLFIRLSRQVVPHEK